MARIWIRKENNVIIDACPTKPMGYDDALEIEDTDPEYVAWHTAERNAALLEQRLERLGNIFIRAIFNPANSGRTVEQIRAQILQQISG